MASLEVLARRLLRAESVASSRIEGLVLSQRRLAMAEVERAETHDDTARSVLGNIAAMEDAVRLGAGERPLKTADILRLHRTLMEATSTPGIAGKLRDQQNWIGGNAFNPGRADFVPPPPEHVPDLVDDLCLFMNRTDLPPIVQAALVHAQFETIHPFADGNGRIGRALIHVVLRRRGLAPRFVLPISLILASRARDYIAGLTAHRYLGCSGAPVAQAGIADWLRVFAAAMARAVADAERFGRNVDRLVTTWRESAAPVRRISAADLLLPLSPSAPVVTVATAARLIG